MPLPPLDPAGARGPGRPRRRPNVPYADRGYDHDKYRPLVWATGVKPVIARRGTEHGSGLGDTGGLEQHVQPSAVQEGQPAGGHDHVLVRPGPGGRSP
ncbi:hypothetical protein [Nonomuraea turkmeniaca]|uniref:hypothetical protein n=1 Tax=Nonomuraea turkmeniaca TaxID=103838 RepID=UPI0014772BA6